MLTEYLQKALEAAHYEIIEDEEPYYGEVPILESVWASGNTLEDCRRKLTMAIEDWIFFSIAKGLPVPPIGGIKIEFPQLLSE